VRRRLPDNDSKWPFWRLSLALIIPLLIIGIITLNFVAIGSSVVSFFIAYVFKREWESRNSI